MALAALTLGGCSTENDLFGDDPNGGPEGEKQQVTFLFPGTAQGVVPYAIASEDENKIATLDVYVFGRDKLDVTEPIGYLLEDVVKMTDKELTAAGDAMQAKLSVVGTNPKVLYFVANGRSHTSLDDYELGVTDTLTFIKKQTTSLGTGLLKAPLLMTGRYTFKTTGAGADAVLDLTGTHAVALDRRVARFDIINTSENSTLRIKEILIKNARPGAYLFAYADTLADKNKPTDAFDYVPAYAGALIPNLMPLDFLQFPTANVGETPSAFYVYPTEVDAETYFHLSGFATGSGSPMVQPVKMRLKQSGTADEIKDLPINPNTRYTIKILDAGSVTIDAAITVAEWKVGQNVDVEAGFGWLKLALEGPIGEVTLEESKLLKVPSDATVAFNIAVTADTEWEIADPTLIPWITIDPTSLPTAGTVGKRFSLATAANPSSEVRKAVVYIRNATRPSVVQALTVEQAANTTTGFKVTGDRLENNTLVALAAGGTTTLSVTGTTTFSCTTGESWITLAQPVTRADVTTPITGDKLNVTLMPNDAKTDGKAVERVGTFTITVGQGVDALTQIITVKQAPKNLGSIVVKAEGLEGKTLTYSGAAQTVPALLVTALTEWKVEAFDFILDAVTDTESEWITDPVITLSDKDPKTHYDGSYGFKLTANASFDVRKSQMTLSNTFDPTIKLDLILIQKGKLETLTLAGGNEYVDATGVMTLAADATTANELTATSDKSGGTLTDLTTTEAASWLEVAVSGEGNAQKITVTPTANTTFVERTAEITVKMTGANDKKLTVKQAGVAPTFTVTGVSGNAIAYGAAEVVATTYTVVPSNGTFTGLTVEKQAGADWLTYAQTTLETDGQFTLAATANGTGAERTATVTITLPNATAPMKITVTQATAPAPVAPTFTITGTNLAGAAPAMTLALSETEYAETTFTVTIQGQGATVANLTIAKQADATWLSLGEADLTNDGTFTLSADANIGADARTATVTVTLAGADAPTVITVTQAASVVP